MSTVSEIREAIAQLSDKDRYLLMAELFATAPEPADDDPALLAALDEAEADVKAGRVYTVEEVRAMIPKWISESSSQSKP
jgi:predicted transcriptional regulator